MSPSGNSLQPEGTWDLVAHIRCLRIRFGISIGLHYRLLDRTVYKIYTIYTI